MNFQMDDLIRRQDAIEAMNCLNDSICEGQATEALCDLPSAQQWIPCSEMLPMDKGVYLVTDDSGMVTFVETSWFMWCDDGRPFWEHASVTAWMPLPEPYKGD